MIRLFIAIPLPSEIEHYLLSLVGKIKGKGIRPVHSVHLTLKFLGWVDEEEIQKIQQRLARVSFEPFELQLQDIGFFPNDKRMRVVWVGAVPHQPLVGVQLQVEDALHSMFPQEERFAPHLTLARIGTPVNKNMAGQLKKMEVKHKKFLVDRIVLYHSILHREGPEYAKLMTISARAA